ncbi:MAG TPA: serine/threonine protein kinase, partial [Actinomycetota bacterium]|nr:serine/threonine protein kinase [Actinomycetota bacterium]
MVTEARVLAGRYELGPLLGRGGMARVHAATDRLLGRRVAVKVLAEPYRRDEAFVERFRREARAA